MSETFILEYIPRRMEELGYSKWLIRYRDLGLGPFDEIRIPAYNEIFFIVDYPELFFVESDYGIYWHGDDFLGEIVHEHRGEILIRNMYEEHRRIRFIQVIIIN